MQKRFQPCSAGPPVDKSLSTKNWATSRRKLIRLGTSRAAFLIVLLSQQHSKKTADFHGMYEMTTLSVLGLSCSLFFALLLHRKKTAHTWAQQLRRHSFCRNYSGFWGRINAVNSMQWIDVPKLFSRKRLPQCTNRSRVRLPLRNQLQKSPTWETKFW